MKDCVYKKLKKVNAVRMFYGSTIVPPQKQVHEKIVKSNEDLNIQTFFYQPNYDDKVASRMRAFVAMNEQDENVMGMIGGLFNNKLNAIFLDASLEDVELQTTNQHELVHLTMTMPVFTEMIAAVNEKVSQETIEKFALMWGANDLNVVYIEMAVEAFLGNVPELREKGKELYPKMQEQLLQSRTSIPKHKAVEPGKTVGETFVNLEKAYGMKKSAIKHAVRKMGFEK